MKKLIFISAFLFCFNSGSSQIGVAVGAGVPEMLNAEISYQIKQLQLGVSYGFLPFAETLTSVWDNNSQDRISCLSFDGFIHLIGRKNLYDRRPWYFRTGIVYFRWKDDLGISKNVLLPLRIGKEFSFSEKTGMSIDGGIVIVLDQQQNGRVEIHKERPLPAIGLRFFYNL